MKGTKTPFWDKQIRSIPLHSLPLLIIQKSIFAVLMLLLIAPSLSLAQDSLEWIAYMSNRDGDWDIYLMSIDLNTREVLSEINLTDNDANDWYPAWSPDGLKLTFQSDLNGNFDIYVMDVDIEGNATRNQFPLTTDFGDDWYPAWSPDCDQIAFTSNRTGFNELYSIDVDLSGPIEPEINLQQLTFDNADVQGPVWSPNGNQIAFASDVTGSFDIYVLDTDLSSSPSAITSYTADEVDPVWFNEGILFSSNVDGVLNIYQTDVEQPNPTPVFGDTFSRWSATVDPSSDEWIAFMSDLDGDNDIYLAQRGIFFRDTNLTENTAEDWSPSWRPDGHCPDRPND